MSEELYNHPSNTLDKTCNYCQGSRKLNRAYKELLGKNKLTDTKGKNNEESICKLIRTVKGNSLSLKPCHHNTLFPGDKRKLSTGQRTSLKWRWVFGVQFLRFITWIGLQGLLSSFVVIKEYGKSRKEAKKTAV